MELGVRSGQEGHGRISGLGPQYAAEQLAQLLLVVPRGADSHKPHHKGSKVCRVGRHRVVVPVDVFAHPLQCGWWIQL